MPLHYTKSGNLDMRYSSSRAAVASSSYGAGGGGGGGSGYSSSSYGTGSYSGGGGSGLHYTKSGNLDMRYSSSKAAVASSSAFGGGSGSGGSSNSYSAGAGGYSGNSSGNSDGLHYTKDGNLDMRYSSSKAAVASGASYSGGSGQSSSVTNIHLKKDGTPDMRYTSSRQLVEGFGKLQVASPGRKAIPSNVPVTKSGLPDMRTKAAKEWVAKQAQFSTQSSGSIIPAWLPTKKDGTLDTKKAVVQEYFRARSRDGNSRPAPRGIRDTHRLREDYYKRRLLDSESDFGDCVARCRREPVTIPSTSIAPETTKIREYFNQSVTNSRNTRSTSTAVAPQLDLASELKKEIGDRAPEIEYKVLEASFKNDEAKATLGSGSFGVVLKANWNDRTIAVKRLHLRQMTTKDKQSFVTEVKILAMIGHHPNLVTLLGYCLNPPAIVMEYVELGSLSFLLHYCEDPKIEAKLTDGRVKKRIIVGIVSGMQQIHAVGVVHGDLKPANVLISGCGPNSNNLTAKVTDFGLASLRGKTSSSVVSTAATSNNADADNAGVAGTGAYMGPELLNSSQPPNFSCDVYSFGILLNEVVQEEEPYSGEEANFHGRGAFGAANYAKLGNRPFIKGETPTALRKLIEDCWNANPKMRPTFMEIDGKLANLEIPNSF